ncbi:MAG: molybdenum cofactor biosynthesis protein B [Bauldia sp.]|nr:molybdenum cofactor biosynthesis protein B [Bauldia sp.]
MTAAEFIPVRFAVLTVSDTRSLEEDRSGQTLAERIEKAGHLLASREIVPDEIAAIRTVVKGWAEHPAVDAIITTGGTGLTGRDVTIEAVDPLFDKRMDGFSTVFHIISYGTIGTSTIQSRAMAGIVHETFVFCLPGSPGACRDAWDGILAPQFDFRHPPCNFVEIMPRLDEHLKRAKLRQSEA